MNPLYALANLSCNVTSIQFILPALFWSNSFSDMSMVCCWSYIASRCTCLGRIWRAQINTDVVFTLDNSPIIVLNMNMLIFHVYFSLFPSRRGKQWYQTFLNNMNRKLGFPMLYGTLHHSEKFVESFCKHRQFVVFHSNLVAQLGCPTTIVRWLAFSNKNYCKWFLRLFSHVFMYIVYRLRSGAFPIMGLI